MTVSKENTQGFNYPKKMSEVFPVDYLHERFNYDKESGKLFWKSAYHKSYIGKEAGSVDNQFESRGYYRIRVSLCGRGTFAHHIIWAMEYGNWPTDLDKIVDHINGDALDNRLENLRLVDYLENSRNASLTSLSTTGIPGVTWVDNRSKWRVRIKVEGVKKSLGSYFDFFEACCARKSAELFYGFHENHGRVNCLKI